MMAIFSTSRTPDSRALIRDSYWPSLATCNMRPLSASRGAMNTLIVLYHKYLFSAPAYAFLVPSSSLRYTVASYELPISRSASSRKAPNAFLTCTACLSRSPVPLSASNPPPPGTWGSGRLGGIRTRHFGTPSSGFRRICMVERAGWCSLSRYLY